MSYAMGLSGHFKLLDLFHSAFHPTLDCFTTVYIFCVSLLVAQSEEYKLLARASRCSRNILEQVNHSVKDCENHHKLVALQKRLDTKPIQNSANPLVGDYKVSVGDLL